VYLLASSVGGKSKVIVSTPLSLLRILVTALPSTDRSSETRVKSTPLPLPSVTFAIILDKSIGTMLPSIGVMDVNSGAFVSYKNVDVKFLTPPNLSTALTLIV
jgi:hypothetical protein